MAAEKSYARLGLFVVVGVAIMLATGLFFVQQMRSRAVISMVTYITENVSGLDISSPVRFRGVPVGRVTDIRVDAGGGTPSRSISKCSRSGWPQSVRTCSASSNWRNLRCFRIFDPAWSGTR